MTDLPSRENVLRTVRPPAIALVVFAVITELMALVGLVWSMVAEASFQDAIASQPEIVRSLNLVLTIAVLVLMPVVLVGGLKMLKLQSHGLALAAAIIALLPLSCCCVIGVPLGVWALVVLLRADVKAAFAAQA